MKIQDLFNPANNSEELMHIDLHVHSNFSDDADFSPSALVDRAISKGVDLLAVADHNTAAGVNEAIAYSKHKPIRIIPAIEIDSIHQGVNLHILGYFINPDDPAFIQTRQFYFDQEKLASTELVRLVEKEGIFINHTKLAGLERNGVVTGEMIAECAINEPENEHLALLEPYRAGGTRSDNPFVNFYWDFCAQGKPAYVPLRYLDLEEVVRMIISSGGIAILAHPGLNVHEDQSLLESILVSGVSGLEIFSSYHNANQIAFYSTFVKTHRCFFTCGSDFHGKTKPAIEIGWMKIPGMDEAEIRSFLDRQLR